MTSAARSYRCYYHPRPDTPAESGVLPSIQLQADNADSAARMAYVTLGRPIDRVERIEPAAWAFAPLTEAQQRERDAMEQAAQAGTLRGLPSAFGALA